LLCTEDWADRTDREEPQSLECEVLQPRLWRKHGGVVHQHIDPAELLVDRGEQHVDLLGVRAIRAYGQCSAPESFDISCARKRGCLVGDKAHRDIVAALCGKPRGRRAYATASTCDQNERRLRDGIRVSAFCVVMGP
jgi:hypothetical protein